MESPINTLFQQSLLQYIKEPFILIDPIENRIMGSNPAVTKFLGYSNNELRDLTVTSIFSFELPALITFTQAVLTVGSGWTNEMSCRHKDGHTVDVEVSASLYDTMEKNFIIV